MASLPEALAAMPAPFPPAWAIAWGEDKPGLYAELAVKDVVQRCRWIEPGVFWMGSPQEELQRSGDETLHEVRLSEGYWLADTACTQALWQAVMGQNPAHFKDDARNPVEQVS